MWLKPFYLSGSWAAVCVGLPVAAASESHRLDPARIALVTAIVVACVHANVILSNLRDAEGLAARFGERRARSAAALLCAAAGALALIGPREVLPLVALPLAMGAAVGAFRPGERFGALAAERRARLGVAIVAPLPHARDQRAQLLARLPVGMLGQPAPRRDAQRTRQPYRSCRSHQGRGGS